MATQNSYRLLQQYFGPFGLALELQSHVNEVPACGHGEDNT